jgi:hypothetical protein
LGELGAGVERRDADALVIWFVVACGGDANDANGQVVGAAGVGGVCVASAVVEGAGIVAVAFAVVVEYVGPFTDDGVDAEVGIAGGRGVGVDGDGDAGGVVGAAVAVVVGVVVFVVAAAAVVDVFSVVVAVGAPVVVAMRGWRGASDIGGDVAEAEGMF